jgi:putative SOS response-associated peptidase YedK
MSRRITPQAKIDRTAFPVTVRVLVPETGLSALGKDNSPWDWLHRNIGLTEYAETSRLALLGHATELHFRCLEDAVAFTDRFPMLVLADDTMSEVYSSHLLPFGRQELAPMCNLYSQTKAQDAMRQLFEPLPFHDRAGNLPPQPEIYPDQMAPIVRKGPEGLVLVKARWGLPTPPQYLVGKKTDRGVTNVRNAASPHWRRWLGPENRCLVPFTRFAEPDQERGGNVWFETADGRPAFFAGFHVPNWTSVRKVKDGETTDDLFAFLTTSPNAEVAKVHSKAMPVILTEPAEWQMWLLAQWPEAKALPRPLTDGLLISR